MDHRSHFQRVNRVSRAALTISSGTCLAEHAGGITPLPAAVMDKPR